ncbi:MAG TPA: polymer-forming cytoskeletal protein [Burkholderiales bacterium]|jgi:cytoskeletal protein CcmA (bactofilin family)|nr:polymer-forming cytoskeletal protein [Burkholderiales bacterium]
MIKSDSLFGKRDDRARITPPPVTPPAPAASSSSAAPSPSSSSYGINANASPKSDNVTPEGGSKLIVGPNIKLKGVEITDCDTLVVEGVVEATMDSRVIQIAQHGTFKGKVGIDVAEIHGAFEGELTARERLIVHATGRVSGKIRYGRLVIEDGGHIDGNVEEEHVPRGAKPVTATAPATSLHSMPTV